MSDMNEFIQSLPKCELHLHIEGSFEPELMFEIAKRNNVKTRFDSVEEIKKAYDFHNLQSFLDIYYEGAGVLLKEVDFYDLTYAYLTKVASENVKHVEIFFDPQTHTDRGVAFDTVISGIHNALVDGQKNLNISFKIIMCFLRHLDQDAAFKTLDMAKPHLDKIIGVGLDSGEVGNPPEKFKDVYEAALELGLKTVAHAGEEGPTEYIWNSLNLLKVSRIDHGVRAIEDDKLMAHLKETQMPLTVCPLSNTKLCVFDKMSDHNIKKMLDYGLCVTVNSDDPAYFGGYMNDNLTAITQNLELSKADLVQLTVNSFEASFLDRESKDKYISEVRSLLS
jgi:adenosine deaminase